MATPLHHAMSSARKHGGTWEQYIHIHNWFDETKSWIPDVRHRTFRHHAEGIFEMEKVFGVAITITLESGVKKLVPTRVIGEQHVKEDCGFIPNAIDYLKEVKLDKWQKRVGTFIDIDINGDYVENDLKL